MTISLWKSDKIKCHINVKFLQGMIDRLTVGYLRYETTVRPEEKEYLKRIKSSIRHYETTKNREFLIDLANYAMREFDYPSMDGTFYNPSDSNGKRAKD